MDPDLNCWDVFVNAEFIPGKSFNSYDELERKYPNGQV
jgi:hypothetical protein